MAFINHLITGGGHIVIKRISVGMNVLNASLVEPSSCFQGDFTRRGFGLGEKEMTKPKRLRGGDATWTMDQLFCHVLRQCKLCHLEPFISRYLLSNPQYAGHNQTSWNSRKKQTSWVLGCLLLRLLRLQHQVHLFFCPGSAAGAAALKYNHSFRGPISQLSKVIIPWFIAILVHNGCTSRPTTASPSPSSWRSVIRFSLQRWTPAMAVSQIICPAHAISCRVNGNFRILTWRYVNVPYFGLFCGDIPWNLGLIYGRYLQ